MNERIDELWSQAAFELNQQFLTCPENWDELMKAKFIELLIQRCAELSDLAEDNDLHGSTIIKRHFEVEG